jgi:Tfp pilus assembly protein PilN
MNRLMAKRILTLYIDDTGIRLLVCKGNRVKKWAELPLQPHQLDGAVITDVEGVASQLRQLLEDQRISVKKVIVGLSGRNCLTRPIVLPQLPKAMMTEAVTREARRLLPVAPEQLYITWQSLPAPEGRMHVFLVAIPRRHADALLKTLLLAKLKPYILGIKPLALANLVREETAIIVDVQPTEFDIVIMVDGIPQPIRTVPFPHHELSWQEKMKIIISDLDRTIKFYNSNSPDAPLNSTVPMYVAGEITNQPDSCKFLSSSLGYEVSLLKSPLQQYRSLDTSRYLANVGLALQEPSLGQVTGPSVAKSNLLPAEYGPKPINWVKVVAVPAAIAVVGLVVPLVMFISEASANIASTSEQLSLANQVLTEKQSQRRELTADIAELGKKLADVESSLNAFNTALNTVNAQASDIDSNLGTTMDNLPKLIQLNSVNCVSKSLNISGVSHSEVEVLAFARSLESSGLFSQVTIISMGRSGDEGAMSFTLVVNR